MKHRLSYLVRRGILVLFVALLPWVANAGPTTPRMVQAAGNCTSANCIFLPAILGPKISGDLLLSHVEVTQGIQKLDNSVPLIAGKETLLRIYARAQDCSQPVTGVEVQVLATNTGGKLLASSPFHEQSTLPLANNRAQLSSTINVRLPSQWTSGVIDLTVRIDPRNSISEADESNNQIHLRLNFQQVPALQIMVVPIQYTHLPIGQTFPAPTSDTISGWMGRVLPVGKIALSWHAPLAFQGNLAGRDDWGRLLSEISALRSSEGASAATVYYGLIPVRNGGSVWMNGSGIGGAGWIGTRVSAGLDMPEGHSTTASNIATHEIGHNLGLAHSPCGVIGGDPGYPYINGSIGDIGVDIATGEVYLPEVSRDLMSYCQPRWISDYSYENILQGQLRGGAQNAPLLNTAALAGDQPARSLLVRANLGLDSAQFLPLYTLAGQARPESPQSAYMLVFFDAGGAELSRSAVEAYQTSLEEPGQTVIDSVVELPDGAALLRLYHGETPLAEQALEGALEPLPFTVEETAHDLTLRWQAEQPVMVRCRENDDAGWVTLAVDYRGGSIVLDRSALPTAYPEFEILGGSLAP